MNNSNNFNMAHYIDADKLIKSIEEKGLDCSFSLKMERLDTLAIVDSLQQEKPEVDLEKLGEIARHIIAVKQNVEDMRLNEDEWSLLERIGYPHKLNARKEDK